jgi:hypothetical protein
MARRSRSRTSNRYAGAPMLLLFVYKGVSVCACVYVCAFTVMKEIGDNEEILF